MVLLGMDNHKYPHTILGGTFDRLHLGHKHFLDTAFAASDFVTIGLTTPVLFGHKLLAENIESYDIRKKELETYLEQKGYDTCSKIIELSDIYGTSLVEHKIDSIFINEHGLKNAEIINEKRDGMGLTKLTIEVVPLIQGDDEKVISSSRIRSGEIDREGASYLKFLTDGNGFEISEFLRNELKKPLGKVLPTVDELAGWSFLITVGDIVTSNYIKSGKTPDISIFDGRSGRAEITKIDVLETLPKVFDQIENAPGSITKLVCEKLFSTFQSLANDKKQSAIKIIGEEDLLTLPAILLAPLDSQVIYGQPNEGIVVVTVTEKKKKEIKKLLETLL